MKIGHFCYTKQNCVPSPHTKFCLNKIMPNYNRFHVNCCPKVTSNILFYVRKKNTLKKSNAKKNVILKKLHVVEFLQRNLNFSVEKYHKYLL